MNKGHGSWAYEYSTVLDGMRHGLEDGMASHFKINCQHSYLPTAWDIIEIYNTNPEHIHRLTPLSNNLGPLG